MAHGCHNFGNRLHFPLMAPTAFPRMINGSGDILDGSMELALLPRYLCGENFVPAEIPNITLEWNAMTCFHPPEKKNVFKFHSRNFYIHHSVDRLISITQRRPSFNLYAWPTPFDVATRREKKHAKIQRIPSDSVGRIATQPQNFQHPFPHHSLTWLEFVYPALFVYQTCW